jgi:hypothetical protein
MTTSNERLVYAASRLASQKGVALHALEFHTPDRRTWSLEAVAAGGFRLFEVDRDQGTNEEHDAVDGDTWELGDALDYLGAVGAAKVAGTIGATGLREFPTRDAALAHARSMERESGMPHYVLSLLYSDRAGDWGVTGNAPLFGEWYTTDGVRHG